MSDSEYWTPERKELWSNSLRHLCIECADLLEQMPEVGIGCLVGSIIDSTLGLQELRAKTRRKGDHE